MKKLTLLFAAGALLAFASCNNNENNTTKEQIDSTVTSRVDATDAALRAKNDSMINAMAKMRADSMMHADSMANLKSGEKKVGITTAKAGVKEVKHIKAVTQPTGTRVTDRPGATDAHINGQTEKPKSVSDRPGATDVHH